MNIYIYIYIYILCFRIDYDIPNLLPFLSTYFRKKGIPTETPIRHKVETGMPTEEIGK